MRLSVEERYCTGCKACVQACKDLHSFPKGVSLLQVFEEETFRDGRVQVRWKTIRCRQCSPAPCARACPRQAIARTEEGVWAVDNAKCTGCGLCVRACPFQAVSLFQGKAVKCQLCAGEAGGPACQNACPLHLIRLE